jgi:radical SAM superfamily enzyme YgiQ (UPF0313 family)
MRVVLADLKGTGGLVTKDTVAGGYGSRLVPFSKVSRVVLYFKQRYINLPSIQMAYIAAIFDRAGHEVAFTRGRPMDGDVAVVLSSLVDHRNEAQWADQMRARGLRVGFVGLAASKMPELFADHADFVVRGEPEDAISRLAAGERLAGLCESAAVPDLDSLPFPRWDLLRVQQKAGFRFSVRPVGGGFPILSSRGCPEFCTYCPHRILAGYRARSVGNIVDEIQWLCEGYHRPHLIFRDPLFTEDRARVLQFCDEVLSRGLRVRFDVETRLDRLDTALLDRAYAAGLRAISYGVESVSPQTLKRVARRPIPEAHHREIIGHCRKLGIVTAAFYVLGFPTDDWQSVAATIDFAIDMDSALAQFKLLTPYPGTPLFNQLAPLVYESDWQKFDGFTPTFRHPNLTARELRFLLGAAYTRFYIRPSYLANLLRVENRRVRNWVARLDEKASAVTSRREIAKMSRPVEC